MESMHPFSEHTSSCLRRAGWFPGRRIDIADYLPALEIRACASDAAVVPFLTEFGGLTVVFPHRLVASRQEDFRINPWYALHELDDTYDQLAGQRLCPVGDYYHGYLALMMSGEGRVFAGMDGNVLLF